MSRICLIDGHSLCYRAFYAVKAQLSTSFGLPTNAVYGFVNMLHRILKDVQPDYLAMCFDVGKPTFRERVYKEYKIHRPSMPDDLRVQIPIIRDIVAAYNIPILEREGYEADDVIAALAYRAEKKRHEVIIVTSDKDLLQLVDSHIRVYNPHKGDGMYYGEKEVEDRFGVPPKQVVDLLSLMGDSSDNIPGAKGVGEKTAVKLLQQFKSVEALLKNSKKIKSDKLRETIEQSEDLIKVSKQLAQLPTDIDVDLSIAPLAVQDPDEKKIYELFTKLEFKSFLKQMKLSGDGDQAAHDDFAKDIIYSEDIAKLKKEVLGCKRITFGALGTDDQFSLCVYCGTKTVYTISGKKQAADLLTQKGLTKVAFDIQEMKHRLAAYDMIIDGDCFDVFIAAYLAEPGRSDNTLAGLAQTYTGLHVDEKQLGRADCVLLYQLYEHLAHELKDKELDKLFYSFEMPLVDVLFTMEQHGFKIDTEFLRDFSKDLHRQLDRLTARIHKLAGREFNINSPKQLREILFDTLGLPVIKKTKTGPSTDEEVLRKLALKHELPQSILSYRQISKLQTTYVDVLPELCDKKTDRIHSHFLHTGTETGRLSSQNPNLQNIPIKTELGRKIRQAFIAAGPQWLLLSADYSQVELRILAHLSGDEVLRDAFARGEDIHRFTAALVHQVEPVAVSDEMREMAKRVNFGVIYGMSAYGLSKDLHVSVDVAQDFIDKYFLRYPKVKAYIQSQIDKAKKLGYVTTLLGRRRYFPYINSKNAGLRQFSERQAVNAALQGSAADLIKVAMVNIHRELAKKKMAAKLISQVHDELVFDFPKKEKDSLLQLVKHHMEHAIQLNVPIQVSLKVGHNWAETEGVEV